MTFGITLVGRRGINQDNLGKENEAPEFCDTYLVFPLMFLRMPTLSLWNKASLDQGFFSDPLAYPVITSSCQLRPNERGIEGGIQAFKFAVTQGTRPQARLLTW